MATLKKLVGALSAALVVSLLLFPRAYAQDVNCAGSFTPSFNCVVTGVWNWRPQVTQAYEVPFKVNSVEATGVVSKVVTLTNTQVLALNITPVTIIPAPGVGKAIDVVSVMLVFNRTGGYTSPQNVKLFYGSRSAGNSASASITGSGFFDASASIAIRVAGTPDNTNPSVSNQAVVIQQATTAAAMASGNAANTVLVIVHYRVYSTGLST